MADKRLRAKRKFRRQRKTYHEWAKSIQDETSWDVLEDYLEGMSIGFSLFPEEDDIDDYILTNEEAWWSDWEMVGRDMRIAMKQAIKQSQKVEY